MDPIAYIVSYINEILTDAFCDISTARIIGICQLVKKTKEDGEAEVVYPVYIDGKFNMSDVTMDDDYKLIIYHRTMPVITVQVAKTGGYGDDKPDTINVAKLCMVVYGDKKALDATREQLAVELQALIPDHISREARPENIKNVSITINEIVLNEEQVFGEEYKNVDFPLGPEHLLMKVNYTIESTFQKNCFNRRKQTAKNC